MPGFLSGIPAFPRPSLPAPFSNPATRMLALRICASAVMALALACSASIVVKGPPRSFLQMLEDWTRFHRPPWRQVSPQLIESRADPDNPMVARDAHNIRLLSLTPGEMAGVVEQVALMRVRYTDKELTTLWSDRVPSVPEMQAIAAARGWPSLRDNCEGQAVYILSLAQALGLEAHAQTSVVHAPNRRNIHGHAWVVVFIRGRSYALNAAFDAPGVGLHYTRESKFFARVVALDPGVMRPLRELGLVGEDGSWLDVPEDIHGRNYPLRWTWAVLVGCIPLVLKSVRDTLLAGWRAVRKPWGRKERSSALAA